MPLFTLRAARYWGTELNPIEISGAISFMMAHKEAYSRVYYSLVDQTGQINGEDQASGQLCWDVPG